MYFISQAIAFIVIYPIGGIEIVRAIVVVIGAVLPVVRAVIKVIRVVLPVIGRSIKGNRLGKALLGI